MSDQKKDQGEEVPETNSGGQSDLNSQISHSNSGSCDGLNKDWKNTTEQVQNFI